MSELCKKEIATTPGALEQLLNQGFDIVQKRTELISTLDNVISRLAPRNASKVEARPEPASILHKAELLNIMGEEQNHKLHDIIEFLREHL